MWKAIKYFFMDMADLIRMLKVGFKTINDFDDSLSYYPDVTQMPYEELKKIQEEAFENVKGMERNKGDKNY